MLNNILIVDSDKEYLKEVEEMLKINNYKTKIFSDPDKCLDYAYKHLPEIILYDINAEGMNGFKHAEKIKNLFKKGTIIIALSTDCNDFDFIELTKSTGIKIFLKKPISPFDILTQINEILSKPGDVVKK